MKKKLWFGRSGHCGHDKIDLNNYIHDEAIPKEIPKIQCAEEGCITLLNSYTQEAGHDTCSTHREVLLEDDYELEDSMWECTRWIIVKNGNTKTRRRCGKKADYRTVLGGIVVMTCPEHLKDQY